MKLAYLAGAVDQVTWKQARQWREDWAKRLLTVEVGSYSPIHAWRSDPAAMTRASMGRICRVNRAALKECDYFILNCDAGPMWGSLRELELAISLGKTTYVVSGEHIPSYESWDITRFFSLDEVMDNIRTHNQFLIKGPKTT